jgi:hypothetical protein
VFATAAYGGRGMRDTRNATDALYVPGQSPLVSLTGNLESGLVGTAEIAVRVGQIRKA